MWFLFAVSIIIASRSEPPGWMIAVTPARAATSMPSGNGKYASEAMTGSREYLQILSLPEDGQGLVLIPGRDDRLVERPLHGLGELARHDPVRPDDPAERRDRVAHESAPVRLRDLVVRCYAARVLVLDDRDGRLSEVDRDSPRRVDVQHVVEARGLAVQLLHRRHRAIFTAHRVHRRLLVRVLAIAQVADLAERERQLVGELHPGLAREARCDRRVVRRRMAEGLGGEHATGLERDVAPQLQLVEHRGVTLRPRDDDNVLVVLRRGAEDRGAADVDLVEQHAAALSRGRVLREGIEVDGDEVDRLDALALELLAMRRIVAAREERGMNLRVERLHTSPQKRWLAGHVFD